MEGWRRLTRSRPRLAGSNSCWRLLLSRSWGSLLLVALTVRGWGRCCLSSRHAWRRGLLRGRHLNLHLLWRHLHRELRLGVAGELAARKLIHGGTGHGRHAGLGVHAGVGLRRIVALT